MFSKKCEMCGNAIEVKDNRRKYCDGCRKARKQIFDENAMKKHREKARMRRERERERIQELLRENEALRAEIIRLRSGGAV